MARRANCRSGEVVWYATDYGFSTNLEKSLWGTLVESRSAYMDHIHQSYARVLDNNHMDVIHGFSRFVDPYTVEVNGEYITADHF